MKKDTFGRKLKFERVIEKLKRNEYIYYSGVVDMANTGLVLFMSNKFSSNLGISKDVLFACGVLKTQKQCGWDVTVAPTVNELLNFKNNHQEFFV
jgi:hypothetical protein